MLIPFKYTKIKIFKICHIKSEILKKGEFIRKFLDYICRPDRSRKYLEEEISGGLFEDHGFFVPAEYKGNSSIPVKGIGAV